MTAVRNQPPDPPFRQMLRLVLPREHGSWSLALEPLVLGLIAVPTRAGFALAVSMLSGFFLRRPLKVLTGGTDSRRPLAWTCLGVLGVLTIAGVALAAILTPPTRLWPLLLAALAGLAFAWFESRGEARAAAAELTGAFAFSIIPAALASVAGWRTEAALALAAVMAGRTVPTVMTIRTYLRRRKGQTAAAFAPLMAALTALAAVGALAHAHLAPPIAVWFMALLLARGFALLGPFHLRPGATRLGVAEATLGGIGAILVAVSWSR